MPDDVWDEAARHFDEGPLSAIITMAALTNMFNRINATIKLPRAATLGLTGAGPIAAPTRPVRAGGTHRP